MTQVLAERRNLREEATSDNERQTEKEDASITLPNLNKEEPATLLAFHDEVKVPQYGVLDSKDYVQDKNEEPNFVIRKRKTSGQVSTTETKASRSHHAKRQCPICKKEDSNLKRHLHSHVRKGHISMDSVPKILSIAIQNRNQRSPARSCGNEVKPGLKLKWCPMKHCHMVTHLMRKHLARYHHVKACVLMEKYLSEAALYDGKTELKKLRKHLKEVQWIEVQQVVWTS